MLSLWDKNIEIVLVQGWLLNSPGGWKPVNQVTLFVSGYYVHLSGFFCICRRTSYFLNLLFLFSLESDFYSYYLYLQYTPAIDIWSIGCIFAEVLTGKPLFPGKSIIHQLELITDLLGTPKPETISGVCFTDSWPYICLFEIVV